MKKHKILAVLMAVIIMTASMQGLTVQADSIGKEARACKELGILIGADASGVTSQYLSTMPTRIQAFIIVLRLKGLYAEAAEYEGENNFKDASDAGWAKSYMAYAKNHSELGWNGYPDGTFAPGAKISGQAFYKVMLEILGYKQGLDFEYDETLEFAEQIGLVSSADAIAGIKSFTVNDIAKGIYSAFNTEPKGSHKNLISVMAENNIIPSDKAAAAGFDIDAEEVNVSGFNVISNNKIEVEFDKEISLHKADVEISKLSSNARLSVLSVESDSRKALITTTEAEPFNAYEITINTVVPINGLSVREYKKKFVAMPADSVKPTATYELLGRNELLINFSEVMERSSAERLSNYIIEDNVVVLSASLSDSGKSVLLETTDMTKFYRLTVQNVNDIAGNSIDRYTITFDATGQDTAGPFVEGVRSESNTAVTVTFSERVDESTAEDEGNYYIEGLFITGAELDESGKTVTLATSAQRSGSTYRLTVSYIEDTWGNVMYRKEYGFVSDNTKASASILAISNNEVQVNFTKQMDKASAEDIGNYSIDNGLEVEDAFLDETGKIVTLITSAQTLRKLYTLSVSDVYDAWGNTINTTTGKFGGMDADSKELSYTAKSGGNQIIVTFNKRVDSETAEDVFNYDLDDALGYAAKAELDGSGRVVTLLTADHTGGKIYTIAVKNVEDIYGNRISASESICTKRFAGIGSSEDGTLTLETVITDNVNTIDLIFNDELTSEELDDMEIAVGVPEEYDYVLPSGLSYYKYFTDGSKNVRIQFKTDSSNNPEVFKWGNIYEVKVLNIDRLNSKNDANIKLFAGTDNPNKPPVVLEAYAINNTAVEVIFSEPVKGMTKFQFAIKDNITLSGVSAADDSEITDRVILYISSATKLKDIEYELYVKSGIKDAAGLNSIDTGTSGYVELYGNSDENEPPFVDSDITVLDSYTIQFEFNEEIKDISSSSFYVKRISGSSYSTLNVSKAVLSEDRKSVTLYLNSKYTDIESGYAYELGINSSVKDLQDMGVATEDRKIEFDGVDTGLEPLEIIAGYVSADNKKITLLTNRELSIISLTMDDFQLSGAGYYKSSSDEVKYDEKSITITLNNELDSSETLLIGITSTGRAKIKDLNNQSLSTEEIEIATN